MDSDLELPLEDAAPAGRPEVTAWVTRGVARLLRASGFAPLAEFKLGSKRRIDLAGLDRKGRFLFVEVKSSLEDFRADGKWREYLDHCDWFYFAVPEDFPRETLPGDHGLMVADGFEAAILRPAPGRPMNGTRRKHQTLRFARQAALSAGSAKADGSALRRRF